MPEIQWITGKDEYSRKEINNMLQTQRAMIFNDVKYLLTLQAKDKGLKGKFTKEGNEIIDNIGNCRKVKF